MSRMTLEVLEQTLFSQGLGREPSAFQRAVTSYFETIGRVDPLDLLGAPAFLPRLRRRRGRDALEFFDSAVDAIIEKRRTLLDHGAEAPNDLLTLLMSAKDPENGRGIADVDVRANIVTFINAGHETTANGLTWTLFLLSQSHEWRDRAEADADKAFDADGSVATERCGILRAVFEEACAFIPRRRCSPARRSPTTSSPASIFQPGP
jgi:cytochrome P450